MAIVVAAVVALVAAWAITATRPSLADAGAFYVDPVFAPAEADPTADLAVFTAWDAPDGGWVSIALENTRPWPLTVRVPERGLADLEVRVANDERLPYVIDLSPDALDLADRVTAAPHGIVVATVHVSARCWQMGAGVARAAESVTLEVTSLGITTAQTLPLHARYLAGYTTDHTPPADCPG